MGKVSKRESPDSQGRKRTRPSLGRLCKRKAENKKAPRRSSEAILLAENKRLGVATLRVGSSCLRSGRRRQSDDRVVAKKPADRITRAKPPRKVNPPDVIEVHDDILRNHAIQDVQVPVAVLKMEQAPITAQTQDLRVMDVCPTHAVKDAAHPELVAPKNSVKEVIPSPVVAKAEVYTATTVVRKESVRNIQLAAVDLQATINRAVAFVNSSGPEYNRPVPGVSVVQFRPGLKYPVKLIVQLPGHDDAAVNPGQVKSWPPIRVLLQPPDNIGSSASPAPGPSQPKPAVSVNKGAPKERKRGILDEIPFQKIQEGIKFQKRNLEDRPKRDEAAKRQSPRTNKLDKATVTSDRKVNNCSVSDALTEADMVTNIPGATTQKVNCSEVVVMGADQLIVEEEISAQDVNCIPSSTTQNINCSEVVKVETDCPPAVQALEKASQEIIGLSVVVEAGVDQAMKDQVNEPAESSFAAELDAAKDINGPPVVDVQKEAEYGGNNAAIAVPDCGVSNTPVLFPVKAHQGTNIAVPVGESDVCNRSGETIPTDDITNEVYSELNDFFDKLLQSALGDAHISDQVLPDLSWISPEDMSILAPGVQLGATLTPDDPTSTSKAIPDALKEPGLYELIDGCYWPGLSPLTPSEPPMELKLDTKPQLESKLDTKPEPPLKSMDTKPEPQLESMDTKPESQLESKLDTKPEPPLEPKIERYPYAPGRPDWFMDTPQVCSPNCGCCFTQSVLTDFWNRFWLFKDCQFHHRFSECHCSRCTITTQ